LDDIVGSSNTTHSIENENHGSFFDEFEEDDSESKEVEEQET
jgi:hypothetical protein